VQAAAGPIAVRTTPQVTRYDLALPDGDVAFYDQFWDRLAPDGGFMVLDDTDLLVLAGPVRAGVRHTFSDHLDGTGGDAGIAHHRVGPLVAWQLADRPPGAPTNDPTVFVLAQWWLQHPYRTGAFPLIAAGFAFTGDLWVSGG
jgi:hypothetical protein